MHSIDTYFASPDLPVIQSSNHLEKDRAPWIIACGAPFQEECSSFGLEACYPVEIGEIMDGRFKVISKIDWRDTHTVWLASDISQQLGEFVVLKVMIDPLQGTWFEGFRQDWDTVKRLAKKPNAKHANIVLPIHDFVAKEGGKRFHVLVYEPRGVSIGIWPQLHLDSDRNGFNKLDLNWIRRNCTKQLLTTLKFLHYHAQVVHGDLNEEQIYLSLDESDEKIQSCVRLANMYPAVRKYVSMGGGKTFPIFSTFFETSNILAFQAKLSSLGPRTEIRVGKVENVIDLSNGPQRSLIQRRKFRAPEVILGLPWSYSAEVWNVGCLLWRLVFNSDLFGFQSKTGLNIQQNMTSKEANTIHLAQIISIVGPPPDSFFKEFEQDLVASNVSAYFDYDSSGQWTFKQPRIVIKSSLQSLIKLSYNPDLQTNESEATRSALLEFVSACLSWNPKKRPSLDQLSHFKWVEYIE